MRPLPRPRPRPTSRMPARSRPAPAPARPSRTRPTRRDRRPRNALRGSLTSRRRLTFQRMMEAVAAIPPFERFYEERRDEIFGYLARLLGPRRRRGCVPGDVPACAARVSEARAREAPPRVGVHDRDARRRRRAAARRCRRRSRTRSPSPTSGPPTPSSSTWPASCRPRSVRRWSSATATTFPTTTSAPRSARARRPPVRPPRPACAACEGGTAQ